MSIYEKIILYLEAELADAYSLYDEYKGKEASKAFACIMKATTIEQLLDEIKQMNN